MSSSTKLTFSGPLRVPRAFQLCEAYGLKTLLGCLNTEEFNFFTTLMWGPEVFTFSQLFFNFSVNLCGYLNIRKFRKSMRLVYNIV